MSIRNGKDPVLWRLMGKKSVAKEIFFLVINKNSPKKYFNSFFKDSLINFWPQGEHE